MTDTTQISIAKRLSRAIFLLIIVTALFVASTFTGFAYVRTIQSELFDQQSSLLANASIVSSLNERMIELFNHILAASSQKQLDDIGQSADRLLESLSTSVDVFLDNSDDESYGSQLTHFLIAYRQAIRLEQHEKQVQLELKQEYDAAQESLYIINRSIESLIATRIRETNQAFFATTGSSAQQSELYEQRQILAELDLIRNKLLTLIVDLNQKSSLNEVAKVEQEYRQCTLEFASLVSRSTGDQQIDDYAQILQTSPNSPRSSPRHIERSVFQLKRRLIDSEVRQASAYQALLQINERFLQVVDQYREYAISISEENAAKLSRRTNVAFSLIVVGLFIVLSCYHYFFRQLIYVKLIAPVLEITQATKKLSTGDLEIDLPDYQTVELQEMTDALDVFRQNSRSLERANKELRKANHDIEDFVYAASHDLKAPLRGIANLTGFLREDLGKRMDPQIENHIDEMVRRTKRLEKLLDDLLAYAKKTDLQDQVVRVDIQSFFTEIFALVNINNAFHLKIDTQMETLHILAAPLSQVLRNLVDNAIKHHDREQGVVTLGVELVADRYQFYVEDDGPGIPTKYHEQIFGLFQTLRPRDHVEGSGMGLALATRILSEFESSIRLISDPERGRGARFEFDWPANGIYNL